MNPDENIAPEDRRAMAVDALMFDHKTVCGVSFRRPSLSTSAYMGIGGFRLLSDPGSITVDDMPSELAGYTFIHAAPLLEVKAAASAGKQKLREAALDFSERFSIEQSLDILRYVQDELVAAASQRAQPIEEGPAPTPTEKNARTRHGRQR